MDANYFESPARPCHSVMGNVIGLFANRAQRGIVLLEAFSVSQRVPLSPTPFEGSLSCLEYICTEMASRVFAVFSQVCISKSRR